MKIAALFLLAVVAAARGEAWPILAEDDASAPAYQSGWPAPGGGSGFQAWEFRKQSAAGAGSHAGFFLATLGGSPGLTGIAIRGKAFGLYANGSAFESAVAFRAFKRPLAVGQTFSFLLENGRIGDTTARSGAVGLVLRAGRAAGSVEEYNRGARFEFGHYAGGATYRIYDGETQHDTTIALTDGGLSVSFTLVAPDTYDLEVTTLADRQTIALRGRKLSGEAGAKIESFALFSRDGESSDTYFNGFQITAAAR